MKKVYLFLSWYFIIGFSMISMAQSALIKTDRPTNGPAPNKYIAPLLTPDNLISVYPQNANYWTGTCNTTTKTDVSEVRGLNTEDGWFIFDVSGIPDGATINAITFHGYVNSTNWPYWSATPMGTVNPISDPAFTIKAQIEVSSGQGIAYVFADESSSFSPGWHSYTFGPQALIDLQVALAQDWFSVGMDSRDNSSSYWINWDGWNQVNDPYLEIDYTFQLTNEIAVWHFDEGSGTIIGDATGNGNDGTLSNSSIWSPNGISGSCLHFDGNSLISIPHESIQVPDEAITIEAWVKIDNYPQGLASTIIIKGYQAEGIHDTYWLHINPDGSLYCNLENGPCNGGPLISTNNFTSNNILLLNQWLHLTYTFNESTRYSKTIY